jgi:RHS repeat-associated protein
LLKNYSQNSTFFSATAKKGVKSHYLYNSNEWQTAAKQYDFNARFYDPVIARFAQVDPLADMFGQEDKWGLAPGDSPTWWGRLKDFFKPKHHIILDEVYILNPGPQKRPSDQDGRSSGSVGWFSWGSMIDYSGFYGSGSSMDGGGGNPDGGNGGGDNQTRWTGGKVNSFQASFAFGGGYEFEIGTVRDARGNEKWFISHGPVIGFNLGLFFSEKAINPIGGRDFRLTDFSGHSSAYSFGLLFYGGEYGGDIKGARYQNSDWSGGINYNQLGLGVSYGVDFGLSWSRTKTIFLR